MSIIRGRALKWIIGGIGGLILLVVIVLVLVVTNLGTVVKTGVETGGPLILGVPTKLDDASISILGGSAELDGLTLGNPEGFQEDMFKLTEARVKLDTFSVLRDEIVIEDVLIDGPHITLEFGKGGATNWQTVLARLEGEPKEEEKGGKKIRIDHLVISNAKISLAGLPLGIPVNIPLPTLELSDIKSADGGGVTARKALTQIVGKLWGSIAAAIGEQRDKLGDALKGIDLRGLGTDAKDIIGGGAEEAKDLLKGLLGGEKEEKDEDEE